MKKKLIIITFFIVLMGILLIFNYNNSNKEDSIESIKSDETKKYEKMLTMMLETGNKTGEYKKTTASKWPTSGYRFNTTLSKCENGGELSWDDTKKTVVMMGTSSDKCYVYFDMFSLVSIYNINTIPDYTSVEVTVNINAGYYDVSKYYFKIADGNYIENDSNTFTFNNLTPNTTYDSSVKIVDSEGNTVERPLSITTLTHTIEDTCSNGSNLVDCLKTFAQNYTLSETNMYYHDDNLANGAGDNSYRFAGTNISPSTDIDGINNFICFGTNESPCPTENLYRILGIYKNDNYYLKLIKFSAISNEMLGTNGAYLTTNYLSSDDYGYYLRIHENLPLSAFDWNSDTQTNSWKESNLNIINLNTNFLNTINQTYENGPTYIGYIQPFTWAVVGNTYDNLLNVTPRFVFKNEMSNVAIYEAKIGLMYVSDYLYAADPSNWSNTPTEYNNNLDSWLYMGINEYTVTRISDSTNQIVRINEAGFLEPWGVYSGTQNFVRPVFFLKNEMTYLSGDGSIGNPIRISL